jgi:uncharacterized membrane protein YphA (DoxX/SURF4 family)
MFATGLLTFLGTAILSYLGATDYFTDKALPSGFAWLLLILSTITTALGFLFLLLGFAKRQWSARRG